MELDRPDPICDAETYGAHVRAFVEAFVQRERRERWLHLLLHRPKQLTKNSSKLRSHLDRRYCIEVSDLTSLLNDQDGVFCDLGFASGPVVITTLRALKLGDFRDAIFSMAPGTLAVYFFHEGTAFICRRK